MKRYKLIKDLPTFNTGDVFYLSEAGNLIRESDNTLVYDWAEIEDYPNILTDWFEEIKEPTRWKPENGETYYRVGSDGRIYDDFWDDSLNITDSERLDIGNCFQTKEEAERVAEYLKALATVRGDATTEFVEDQSNYYVYYNTSDKYLCYGCSWSCNKNGIFGLPYFATAEDAQRSIEQHRNEWLTIFGIKEEE